MNINEIGKAMLSDGWLCPSVPRDDLGAGGESIRAMAEVLCRYDVDTAISRPKLKPVTGVLKSLLTAPGNLFSTTDTQTVRRGLRALEEIVREQPDRIIGEMVAI